MPMTAQEQNFQDIAKQVPEATALLQTLTTQAVIETEITMQDSTGEEKKKAAEEKVVKVLQQVYGAADLWFGFPAIVDKLAIDVLIPLIPGAIDGIVRMFNGTGIFSSES